MIRLLFPPRCIFCDSLINIREVLEICSRCKSKLHFPGSVSLDVSDNSEEKHCEEVIYVCDYSGIMRNAILEFKFKKKPSFFRSFGLLLSLSIKSRYASTDIDYVTEIPLHKSRLKERGFNQSELLAGSVSKITGIKHIPNMLKRVKQTDNQSSLKRNSRLENIKNAFDLELHMNIKNKTILLVDDVLTTGATIDECAKTLIKAGAKRVVGAVIASGRNVKEI